MSHPDRAERLIDEHTAAEWITDGMTIAIGDPAPMAMIRHIVRRGVRDLTVVGSGLGLDLLIAAGCVRKAVAYYVGGGPAFRAAAEGGDIEVWECEEGVLVAGLRAAAQGLPFLPWRGGLGTSLPEINPDLRVFEDPINGETLLAVPAIDVDVAILHAAHADAFGNVQHVGGPGWLDLFLLRAADRSIVQVEKILPNEEVRAKPWATTIARIDAVVRLPFGAHPFASNGFHVQDKSATRQYVTAAAKAQRDGDRADLDAFITTFCREPASHLDYLELIGVSQLLSLHEY